jgi:hypothetical protein
MAIYVVDSQVHHTDQPILISISNHSRYKPRQQGHSLPLGKDHLSTSFLSHLK